MTLAMLALLGAFPGEDCEACAKEAATSSSASAPGGSENRTVDAGVVQAAARPQASEPPAPPRQYLETAAELFNKRYYSLAAKYLKAAQLYRDRLSTNEQLVLDIYQEKLDRYNEDLKKAVGPREKAPESVGEPEQQPRERVSAAPRDEGVVAASTAGPNPRPVADPFATLRSNDSISSEMGRYSEHDRVSADSESSQTTSTSPRPSGDDPRTLRESPDAKQRARWLLHQAREQIFRGQFDEAAHSLDEAQRMNVHWSWYDDTPEKAGQALAAARQKGAFTPPQPGDYQNRDRREARIRLRDARGAIAAHQLDKAEQIVREVRGWNLRFGLFDDTPDKVDKAIFDARQREAVDNAELMVRSYLESTAPAGRGSDPRSSMPSPYPPPRDR